MNPEVLLSLGALRLLYEESLNFGRITSRLINI